MIYCLNCGSLRPYWPRIQGGVTCLLVECDQGPVLIDTGFGTADYLSPNLALNLFMRALRVPRDPKETAISQLRALGVQPEEVRHIVMTHLHLDHAGGLPDFPWAQVHLYQPEYRNATSGGTGWEFVDDHWRHEPRWRPYTLSGETWFEFEGIKLTGFKPEIWLVPFIGHSPGHCGVAVETAEGWILYAGDAVPFNNELDKVPTWLVRWLLGPHAPTIFKFVEKHPEIQLIGAHMDQSYYSNWIPVE